ncbi:hypothetical protein T265_07111 [Opisthorchis viverrini]|uniref:Glycosyl hydrolase family 38 C-terminal domain-containing protein n=1 Tax=Opisthorchis viverrini TaxID=6198 RepID=A0A074ZQ19_OPIVI|nr:hypothetical protein T265_07111 [Opisthorchis viverrini]KER25430.1 hypothetical protein T265_07111 [Opisthorchis viverrini]
MIPRVRHWRISLVFLGLAKFPDRLPYIDLGQVVTLNFVDTAPSSNYTHLQITLVFTTDSTGSLVYDILQLNALHTGRLRFQLVRYSRHRISNTESLSDSQGEFFTDSSGRQLIRRIRTKNLHDPIASNYYPVINRILIKGAGETSPESPPLALAVYTDRPQGGSSLEQGQLELMVHRRLVRDDSLGLNEALMEQGVDNHGLIRRIRTTNLHDPIASNYYPVINRILIKGAGETSPESPPLALAVYTDRPQGGSSLEQGQLELMVHRRLVRDDGLGVNEALMEQGVDNHVLRATAECPKSTETLSSAGCRPDDGPSMCSVSQRESALVKVRQRPRTTRRVAASYQGHSKFRSGKELTARMPLTSISRHLLQRLQPSTDGVKGTPSWDAYNTNNTQTLQSNGSDARKHEGWDTARFPKPRERNSRGGGRARTTDLPATECAAPGNLMFHSNYKYTCIEYRSD